MDFSTSSTDRLRELDRRAGDGIDVALLWDPADDSVVVRVVDERDGVTFEIPAPAADALEVFNHPFAYAPGSTTSIALLART